MRFFPVALLAAIAAPAAAHDAPMALVEATDRHLVECNDAAAYEPNGELRSEGWTEQSEPKPLMAERLAGATWADDPDPTIRVFSVTLHGHVIDHSMARWTSVDGEEMYSCITVIDDFPYMPDGRLLGGILGVQPDFANTNSPGDYRDGWWIWESVAPQHLVTGARYTNSHFGAASISDLPDDVLYPGFYILTEFTGLEALTKPQADQDRLTPEQSNSDTEESKQR